MITKEKICKIKDEVERLMAAIEELELNGSVTENEMYFVTYYDVSKYTGAVNRASLDLTRALAEFRRS